MRANLHLHSIHSDGKQWPAEMAVRCSAANVALAALTDHDTMAGVPDFLAACRAFGIRGVAGVEIDCVAPEVGYDKELLGYFPSGDAPQTRAFLARGLAERERVMAEHVAEARERYGRPELSMDGLREFKAGFIDDRIRTLPVSFIKVDLYRYLKRVGALPAGAGYLDFKKAGFKSAVAKPHLREVAAMIQADGGFAVLPHPGFILDEKGAEPFARLLALCHEAAVWGVELYWYGDRDRTERLNAGVAAAAAPHGFRFTHGSDCHGRGSEFDTLEKYAGDFKGFDA